jgi:hypothetical protein
MGVLRGLVHGIFGKQHNHKINCGVCRLITEVFAYLFKIPRWHQDSPILCVSILCLSRFVITMTSSSHYSPCIVEECFSPLGGMMVSAVDAELRQLPSNNARHLSGPRRRGSSHRKCKSAGMVQQKKKISSTGDQEMEKNGQRNFKLFSLFHRFQSNGVDQRGRLVG